MFGDSHYLENNSFSTSHQSVNVYGLPEKRYEVRAEDNAVDIQIHRKATMASQPEDRAALKKLGSAPFPAGKQQQEVDPKTPETAAATEAKQQPKSAPSAEGQTIQHLSDVGIQAGDVVRIVRGALRGHYCRVETVDCSSGRVRVTVYSQGRRTSINMRLQDIRKEN